MKVIIVGGVAGGATAAARIRRNTEKAEIILFEKGEYISYANCGLPYYIGGVIEERDRLFVQTPEAFGRRFNIDVRTQSEVVAIDRANKVVTVRKVDGTTYNESYDKLLLSPGASPVRPPLKGIDLDGIFTLRNVNDTDRIKQYLGEKAVKSAVIVGGGFIGLEMAENLVHAGVEVSVVEMADQVMGPIDYSMAALVHEHLVQKGIKLYLQQAVEAFEAAADGLAAELVQIAVELQNDSRLRQNIVVAFMDRCKHIAVSGNLFLAAGLGHGFFPDDFLQPVFGGDDSLDAVGRLGALDFCDLQKVGQCIRLSLDKEVLLPLILVDLRQIGHDLRRQELVVFRFEVKGSHSIPSFQLHHFDFDDTTVLYP